jgi:putative transposase
MPRFFVPGAPLHLVQRGNNRTAILCDDADAAFLLGCIQYAAHAHVVAIHAYVLMTNHLHVLATPGTAASAPRMMQRFGTTYAKYFNAKYRRTGALFEGRYRATVIDDEAYLLTTMRYIELNPVRAGMVTMPGKYRWSSFGANAHGSRDPIVTPHALYSSIGRTSAERQASYRALFGTAPAPAELDKLRDATAHGWALGTEAFCRRVEAESPTRAAIAAWPPAIHGNSV